MRSLLTLWLSIAVAVASAQNLIPNGDLEDYAPCPTSNSQIDRAAPWFNAFVSTPWGPGPTPDYFNECTSLAGIDVPVNNYGVQIAHSGSAYAGFMVYLQYSPDFREYMEVQWTQPLIAGKCYELSLYLSLAETIGNTASGDIGAYFSGVPLVQAVWDTLPVVPQLDHLGGFLADTLDWIHATGVYQAQGGEEYLTIGNFHSDMTTGLLALDTLAMGVAMSSYYFIDDVSLELVKLPPDGGCGTLSVEDPALPAMWWLLDPSGDELMVSTSLPGRVTMTMWDLSGKVVLTSGFDQRATLGIGHLAEGLYAFELADPAGTTARGRFIK
ncbi:MAG: hypothetical protein ABI432_11115 [Flavobacteriales bacterium]